MREERQDPYIGEIMESDASEDSLYPHLSRSQLEMLVTALAAELTPSQRVMQGFVRLGLVLAAIPVVSAAVHLLIYRIEDWEISVEGFLITAGLYGVLAIMLFVVPYALGWIVAGFMKR